MDAIAREGTLTRVAACLNVTQPALSRHLQSLERRLAVPLFHRTGRRLVPTRDGALVISHAEDLLAQLARVQQAFRTLGGRRERLFRLGCECFTAFYWLPRILDRMTARHPDTAVDLALGATRAPLVHLRRGTIELALINSTPLSRRFAVQPIFADEFVALVAPNHAWASRTAVAPGAFRHEHVLLVAPPQHSTFVLRFLDPAGVQPRRMTDVSLVGALVTLVEGGYGVGVLPRWIVGPEIRAGRLVAVRLGRRGLGRPWNLATPRRLSSDPWVQEFIRQLATVAPQVPDSSA